MSGWSFDEARFVEEVLRPVQDGWPADQDLFRVYQLPLDATDEHVIATALDEINRQFGRQQYRALRRACELLSAQHPMAVELLLDRASRKAHYLQVRARLDKLMSMLRHRLNGAPGLPAAEVKNLVRSSNGAFTLATVRAALAELGARVRDPIDLPPAPQPSQWAQARGLLTQLRHRSVWSYLVDVPELAGPATTQRQLDLRRGRLRVSRTADSTAETSLLKIVEGWLANGGLTAALRHEVVEELTREAEFGYPAVSHAAGAVGNRLAVLGLPADPEAVAYAAWCIRFGSADREPGWVEAYQSALRAGQLRAALTVLAGQPSLPAEWRRKSDELKVKLAELDDELARCRSLERVDVEAAVEGYLRLATELADPAIDSAIERCRPAPARDAVARADGGRVVISWQPSRSTAGRISYRVTRGDIVVADSVTACAVTDSHPPGGAPLVYTVCCERNGNAAADDAHTNPVTVLPEVEQPQLQGGSEAISGQWRLPDGANGAVVSRREGSAAPTPLRGQHITSFVDRDVRQGRTYDYRIRARYRLTDGSTALSDGIWMTASCQELPVAVTVLHVELDGEEIVASWMSPARGEVELLELHHGMDIPDPAVVPVSTARRYGTALAATGHRVRGHLRSRAPVHGQRLVLLPVTVLGELAAIGNACEVDPRHGHIRGLRALRLGSTVQLTWVWPPGTTEVRVLWRAQGKPAGPMDPDSSFLDLTRVGYDSKGFVMSVSPGEHWFGVCTMITLGAASTFGPLAIVRESTQREAVYRVRRRHLPPRQWALVVEDPTNGELPPVVLLAKAGVRSMNSQDGQPVLRLPGGPSPMRGLFLLPKTLGRPIYLRAFALDDGLVLVPARPADLIIG